ncbi:MAG: hypothetical protein LQ337_008353, partial [Flavoplaca oasis]
AAACASAFTEGTIKSDMEERDLTLIINTQKDITTAQCDGKTCFTECADKGAIGGACEADTCVCQYGPGVDRTRNSPFKSGKLRVQSEDCDPEACNDTCYEKGGYFGGICNDAGACECAGPGQTCKNLVSPFH